MSGVKRGIYLPPEIKTGELQPFNILVRSPNWLGDACMAAPAIRAIKAGRPDLHLTMLAPMKLAPLWREIREVDQVLEIPSGSGPWRISKLLKKTRDYDVAILLPNSVRSALEVWFAGIPRRVGRAMHRGGRLLNQNLSQSRQSHPTLHQGAELLEMIRTLGAPNPQPVGTRDIPSGPLRVGLCPGAEYGPAKRWPIERYRKVMELVSAKFDLTWVIVGSPKEAQLGKELALEFEGKVENICGKTTLPELIDQLKGFHLLLTNDTGTMHLADLLGVTVVAIFGSTEPDLTGPTGTATPLHRILRHKVECNPCFLRKCPIDFRCMNELSVETVSSAVLETLNEIEKLRAQVAGQPSSA